MNLHHGRDLARPQAPLMPVILQGRAWTARHIRNNCLRQHGHALAASFRLEGMAPLKVIAGRILVVLEARSRVLTDIHPNQLPTVALCARLAAYADQWLRQPEEWWPDTDADARSQWASLLRHLLARYPVPAFLDSAWRAKGALRHFERDCWCALAVGRSLREVAGFPKSISNRVLHTALTSGKGETLVEAIWRAQLRCLRAPSELAITVLHSRATTVLGDHAILARLTEKFVAHPEIPVTDFHLVADALIAARQHRGPAQLEPLLRLPLPMLIRHSLRFLTELLQTQGHTLTEAQVQAAAAKAELAQIASSRWLPIFGSEPFRCKNGRAHGYSRWQVVELCSVAALRAEGRFMRHCVAGYAYRCRCGSSAIFSVRKDLMDGEGRMQAIPHATIEVHPRTQRVVQIRAPQNRPVNRTVMNLIQEWASAHHLGGVR